MARAIERSGAGDSGLAVRRQLGEARRATALVALAGPLLAVLAFAVVALAALAAVGCDDAGASSDAVTFAEDVAPILVRHCAACHQPGQVGPFPLLTYEQVRKRGRQIVEVTASGFMPPWQPQAGYGDFEGERRLSVDELATLRRWVAEGMAAGDLERAPEAELRPSGWQLGEPDLVLRLDEPYPVPAGGPDFVRNFVVALPLDATRFVRAVELLPGNARLVHHANVLADTTGEARRRDAVDEEPGYPGMEEGGIAPDGHFFGWTPGRMARELDEGMAWTARPGTDVVLQVHVQPTGKPEALDPEIGLYFTDRAPERVPATVHMVSTTIDIPAGEASYTTRDEWTLPVAVDALAIYPHAHYLGKVLEAKATLPDGSERWLLRIDDWDFNWQDEYHYREPIHLPAGTRLELAYTYDNTAANPRNPHVPPQRVVWGPSSRDEMANYWLKVVPRAPDDLESLKREVYRKDLDEALAGYRVRVEVDLDDVDARSQVAHVLVAQGRYAEALPVLEELLERRGDAWYDHYNLALARAGVSAATGARAQLEGAASAFERAVELNPGSAAAEQGLAGVLTKLGRTGEALAHTRRALELRPDSAELHSSLAVLLVAEGRVDDAVAHYDEALRLDPSSPTVRGNYAVLLARLGRLDEAQGHLREALRLRPEAADLHRNLANVLARQGDLDQAVAHLRRAVELAPEDAEARYFLAMGLAQQGELGAAQEELRAALAAAPDFEAARRLLDELSSVER